MRFIALTFNISNFRHFNDVVAVSRTKPNQRCKKDASVINNVSLKGTLKGSTPSSRLSADVRRYNAMLRHVTMV